MNTWQVTVTARILVCIDADSARQAEHRAVKEIEEHLAGYCESAEVWAERDAVPLFEDDEE